METFSQLLTLCAGNSPVTGEFLTQRPVTRGFGVFLDLRLNKRLSKQSWGWWFETPSRPLWRQCNARNNSHGHQAIYFFVISRCVLIHIEAETRWPPFSYAFSWMKMFQFSITISPRGPIDNIRAVVQIMAWRLFGAKPLPEPMMFWITDAYMPNPAVSSR